MFTDVPGTVRYFRVGRVPVKLTYGPAEVQFQGRGWVKVDAHNLVCPEMRHALTYIEQCEDVITIAADQRMWEEQNGLRNAGPYPHKELS